MWSSRWHRRSLHPACRSTAQGCALDLCQNGGNSPQRTSVSMERASENSDVSTQTDLLKKETSVQASGCSECPHPSGENISTYKRCAEVKDLLHQVVKLPETVDQLHGFRETETEIARWFQNHLKFQSWGPKKAG